MSRYIIVNGIIVIFAISLISYAQYLQWIRDSYISDWYGGVEEIDSNKEVPSDIKYIRSPIVLVKGNLIISNFMEVSRCPMQVYGIRLKRFVEMFSWIKQEAIFSEFYFKKDWARNPVSFMIGFDHTQKYYNPIPMLQNTDHITSATAFLGKYKINQNLYQLFSDFYEVQPVITTERIKYKTAHIYCSEKPSAPNIGDYLLTYFAAGVQGRHYSIVALLKNDTLFPYITNDGKNLSIVKSGNYSLGGIFIENDNLPLFILFLRVSGLLAFVQIIFINRNSVDKYKYYLLIASSLIVYDFIFYYLQRL